LALIADIFESVKNAFGGIQDRWTTYGDWTEAKTQEIIDSIVYLAETTPTTGALALVPGGEVLPGKLAEIAAGVQDDAEMLAVKVFDYWTSLLNAALGQLNIDAPDNLDTLRLGDPFVIQSLLNVQGRQAQERVALAIGAINTVLAIGNAISAIAEAASAGTVRSFSEAVQSWIWANGLGQLGSMAYQPQLDASVNPLLTRLYNQRSQTRIPDAGDLIRFQLREVYDPIRREELLQGEPRPTFNTYMEQNGYSEYHSDSFWAAHWVLPSISQLNEMLFRGVIDSATWRRFVQYNDYDPSSIPRLEQIIYRPFTRVDARRMASLGVLSREELLQAYADVGYYAETRQVGDRYVAVWKEAGYDPTIDKAQALAIWTAMFNAMPILRSRYRNGWINADELRVELAATGLPEAAVEERYEMIVKASKEERAAPEKDLTRALVVRAWKLRLISFVQAQFLLRRMGYDFNEGELILKVQSMPDDPLAYVNTALGARLLANGTGSGVGGEEPPEDMFPELEG